MNAFDTAWNVVKMARHVVDDLVEIWDYDEDHFGGVYNKLAPEGYEHLPTVKERPPMPDDYGFCNTDGSLIEVDTFDDVPEDERRWGSEGELYRSKRKPKSEWWSFRAGSVDPSLKGLRGDGYVYGNGWFPDPELPEGRDKPLTFEEIIEIHRQYYDDDKNWSIGYPWGGGIGRGDHVKIMVTPNEFLNLASEGHDEERALEFVEQWKKNKGRTPIGIPYLRASLLDPLLQEYRPTGDKKPLTGPQDYKITGHEGRHRMAALRAMGYGETPLPVHFELDNYDRHAFGMNPKGRNKGLEESFKRGMSFLTPQNMKDPNRRLVPYRRKTNPIWGKGEVEYLEKSDFYFGSNDPKEEGGFWSRVGTQGYKGAEHLKDDKGYVTGVNLSHPIYQTEDPIERIIRTIAHEEGHEAIYDPLRETRELEFEDVGYEPTYFSEFNPSDQQQEYGAMLMEGMKHDEIIEELRRRGFFDY